jgi:hypothetical protein
MGPVAVAGDGALLQDAVEDGVDEAEEHVEDVQEGEDGSRERRPRPLRGAREEACRCRHDGRGGGCEIASRKAGKAWWRECAALLHVASLALCMEAGARRVS